MDFGSILDAFWDVFSSIFSIPFSMRFCKDFGGFLRILNLDFCNTLHAKTRFLKFSRIRNLIENYAKNHQEIDTKWCQNQLKFNWKINPKMSRVLKPKMEPKWLPKLSLGLPKPSQKTIAFFIDFWKEFRVWLGPPPGWGNMVGGG